MCCLLCMHTGNRKRIYQREVKAVRHLWYEISFSSVRCFCSLRILNFPIGVPQHLVSLKNGEKLIFLLILFHTITLALISLKQCECAWWGGDIEGNWSSPCPGYSHPFGEWKERNRSASLSERRERKGNRTADKRSSVLISLASSIVGSSVCRSAAQGELSGD